MVAAHTRVYVPEELAPLGNRYVSLQDAGGGTLVQLAVDEGEGLGHPGGAPSQAMYLSRQYASLGAGSTSMASASSVPYPLRRESTNASFEGSTSIGSVPAGLEGAPEGPMQFEGCSLRVTDGWATSQAKRFGGTVIRPDAILASSSASSLYWRGT
jgi:hypothetical protein